MRHKKKITEAKIISGTESLNQTHQKYYGVVDTVLVFCPVADAAYIV